MFSAFLQFASGEKSQHTELLFFFAFLYVQAPSEITSLSSPTSQSNLVPNVMRNNTKYSRLATTGSPSHSKVTSTQELLQQQIRQQEHLVNHQDAQLSQMSQSVGTLRNMSSAIGNELDEQAVMLDEFGGMYAIIPSFLLMMMHNTTVELAIKRTVKLRTNLAF